MLQIYRPPILVWIQRKFYFSEEETEDFFHDFVHDKILTKNILAAANPKIGKFRSLLLTALQNDIWNRHRKRNAKKRRPENGFTSLDELPNGTVTTDLDTDYSFRVEWAFTTLRETLLSVREQYLSEEKLMVWKLLRWDWIEKPVARREGLPVPSYEELVSQMGFRSAKDVGQALTTGLRRLPRSR